MVYFRSISHQTDENSTCDGIENVYRMRIICTDTDDPPESCYPDEITPTFGIFAGAWGIFVATIGILGNLLTLIAIPVAANHKRSVTPEI